MRAYGSDGDLAHAPTPDASRGRDQQVAVDLVGLTPTMPARDAANAPADATIRAQHAHDPSLLAGETELPPVDTGGTAWSRKLESAARKLQTVSLDDALRLTRLYRQKPELYERAAAKWVADTSPRRR